MPPRRRRREERKVPLPLAVMLGTDPDAGGNADRWKHRAAVRNFDCFYRGRGIYWVKVSVSVLF